MKSREAHTGRDILAVDHSEGALTEASHTTASTTGVPGGWYALRAAVPGTHRRRADARGADRDAAADSGSGYTG